MNPLQVAITAVLVTLVALSLTMVTAWSMWPRTAEASVNLARHADTWHTGENPHCAHLTSDHLIVAEAVATALLDLDETQVQQLAKISARLEQWRSEAQQACVNADISSLDGALAGVETFLAMSAGHIGELRPVLNEFYAGLTDDQQSRLREIVHDHAGRDHGSRRHSYWGH